MLACADTRVAVVVEPILADRDPHQFSAGGVIAEDLGAAGVRVVGREIAVTFKDEETPVGGHIRTVRFHISSSRSSEPGSVAMNAVWPFGVAQSSRSIHVQIVLARAGTLTLPVRRAGEDALRDEIHVGAVGGDRHHALHRGRFAARIARRNVDQIVPAGKAKS